MNRLTCLIIALGWISVVHLALAGDINRFRDSRGTIHITNVRPKAQASPALSAGAEVPLPQTQPPAPTGLAASTSPAPVDPRPAPRAGQKKGEARGRTLAQRPREKGKPGPPAGAPTSLMKSVSWSPQQPAPAAPNGKIVIQRDPRGVIHIKNVASEEEPPAGPGFIRPPPGSPDRKVVARRDRRGVWHIFNLASVASRGGKDSPASLLGKIPPVLQACIAEAAQLYRLPVSLIMAVIRQESNFAPQAVSPKGAMGLMQLMPATAAALGVRDPFDPRENILAGCRYFRHLLDYFQGSVPLALAGYNAGHHRVISAGCQVPAIKETQEFVTQVMGLYYLLENPSGL